MSVRKRSIDRLRAGAAFAATAVVLFAIGCNQNPYLAGPGGAAWQPARAPAVAGANPTDAQLAELSRRVQLLDDNNRQLHTQLAQSEQQSQVYRDELSLVRQQLADTTKQFESTKLVARMPKPRCAACRLRRRRGAARPSVPIPTSDNWPDD